jgi:hypothetical protein
MCANVTYKFEQRVEIGFKYFFRVWQANLFTQIVCGCDFPKTQFL